MLMSPKMIASKGHHRGYGFAAILLSILTLFSACGDDPIRSKFPLDTYFGTQCDVSPDGHTIAVAWAGEPSVRPSGLYLIDTIDWSIRHLFVPNIGITNFSSPSWSPDGEWLAFGFGTRIFKIKRNGDSVTQLTDFGEQFICDWSPADTAIVSVVSIGPQAGTWIYDKSGGNPRLLVDHGVDATFLGADSILYLINKPTNQRDSAQCIVRNLLDGGERILLEWRKGAPYRDFDLPNISPDGNRIVASADGHIVTLSMEGDDLRVLTDGSCFYPAWTADGSQIIYNYDPLGESYDVQSLWIMNADGSNKHPIPGW